jgi:DNA modification methylase
MDNNIQVVYRQITNLSPAEYNPRKHTTEQANQLKESIKRFGFIDPIICNSAKGRENIVIGGHFRLDIAKELKMVEVPVVFVNILDLEKEKELNVRLNKNTGEFDFEKLQHLNFDMLLDIGFDQKELDDIWNIRLNQKEFNVEEELKKIKETKTQKGDVIEMDGCKLICGDSLLPETLQKLFGDERASMIISDPIYNISISYDKGISGKQSYGGSVDDNKTDKEYEDFLRKSMVAALAVTKDDAHVCYWSDEASIWQIQVLYRELGITNRRVCLWLKNGQSVTPQIAFSKCYEPCTYGTRGKPYITKGVNDLNEVMNNDMTTGNNLLQQAHDHLTVWMEKRLPSNQYEHSTMKPPEVYEKAIRRCTRMNDIILDSFSGSGSTIMAGIKLKRKVYAVEIEPVFCDLTIRRYEALTGKKAKVIRDDKKA